MKQAAGRTLNVQIGTGKSLYHGNLDIKGCEILWECDRKKQGEGRIAWPIKIRS